MKNLMNKLMVKLGLKVDTGSTAHIGANPVYFTNVYSDGETFTFSWRTADHSLGAVVSGFTLRSSAENARGEWEAQQSGKDLGSFVRE